jgi:cytochrome c biogenesis protein CcmG, thiol:disulfide interchange protein DsbE
MDSESTLVIKHSPVRIKSLLIAMAVLALLLAAATASCASSPTGQERGHNVGPFVGNLAPAFSLSDGAGKIISLSDLKGTPVMINFWATW